MTRNLPPLPISTLFCADGSASGRPGRQHGRDEPFRDRGRLSVQFEHFIDGGLRGADPLDREDDILRELALLPDQREVF